MSLIIAEIGTSHEGSIEKAKLMIDEAVEAGADCVKFQWVYADEILHPKTGFVNLPTGKIPLYDRFKQLECPIDFYKETLDYAHSKNAKYCCSPFGLRSLKELLSLNPDYVKIASPELNHYPMLKSLAAYRAEQIGRGENPIPVIVSSGVSKMEDIEKAVKILGTNGVSLLHCITQYPAPETEYNLNVIKTLKQRFGIPCGVSDHSLDPVLVPVLSVAVGGSIIEKHITLSKKTSGLDDPVALEGEQFALMVHCVHQAEAAIKRYGYGGAEYVINQLIQNEAERMETAPQTECSEKQTNLAPKAGCLVKKTTPTLQTECSDAELDAKLKIFSILGDGIKKLAPAEESNYGRTNRSLHFMRDMKKGEIITESDIAVLRTEKILSVGISPEYYDDIIGKTLAHDIHDGDGVQLEDFST